MTGTCSCHAFYASHPCRYVTFVIPLTARSIQITFQEYKALMSQTTEAKKTPDRANVKGRDPMEAKTQGVILLQSLLRLAEPHNQIVIDR